MKCCYILDFLTNKYFESRKFANVIFLNLLAFFHHSLNETNKWVSIFNLPLLKRFHSGGFYHDFTFPSGISLFKIKNGNTKAM